MPDKHSGTKEEKPDLHSDVEFDGSEPSLIGVLGVLLAIFVSFMLSGFVAWRFVQTYMTSATASAAPKEKQYSYNTSSNPLPKEPRLEPLDRYQGDTDGDIFARQTAMESTLHNYGRTSDQNFVHIPVEEAIKILAGKLPSQPRSSPNVYKSYGLVEGGESNSGRIYQEAPSWLEPAH